MKVVPMALVAMVLSVAVVQAVDARPGVQSLGVRVDEIQAPRAGDEAQAPRSGG